MEALEGVPACPIR